MKLTAQHIETLKLLGFTEAEIATFESVLNEDPQPSNADIHGRGAKGLAPVCATSFKF